MNDDIIKEIYDLLEAHIKFYEFTREQDFNLTLTYSQAKTLRNALEEDLEYIQERQSAKGSDEEWKHQVLQQ